MPPPLPSPGVLQRLGLRAGVGARTASGAILHATASIMLVVVVNALQPALLGLVLPRHAHASPAAAPRPAVSQANAALVLLDELVGLLLALPWGAWAAAPPTQLGGVRTVIVSGYLLIALSLLVFALPPAATTASASAPALTYHGLRVVALARAIFAAGANAVTTMLSGTLRRSVNHHSLSPTRSHHRHPTVHPHHCTARDAAPPRLTVTMLQRCSQLSLRPLRPQLPLPPPSPLPLPLRSTARRRHPYPIRASQPLSCWHQSGSKRTGRSRIKSRGRSRGWSRTARAWAASPPSRVCVPAWVRYSPSLVWCASRPLWAPGSHAAAAAAAACLIPRCCCSRDSEPHSSCARSSPSLPPLASACCSRRFQAQAQAQARARGPSRTATARTRS